MKYLIIALCFAFTLTSCEDKNDDVLLPSFGTMELKLDHRWGHDHAGGMPSEDFELNKNYIIHGTNDTVLFNKFMYYVSNIKLTTVTGKVHSVPNSYNLVDVTTGNLQIVSIDSVPTAEYVKVSFMIGVDSLHNVSGAQTGDLAPSKEMFWSWNTGYRFIVAEGKHVKQSGNTMFTYHIGGFLEPNNAIKELDFTFENNLSVSPEATPRPHFNVNVGGFWNNTTSIQNYTMVHMPGAKAVVLANNFSGAVELDHDHQ